MKKYTKEVFHSIIDPPCLCAILLDLDKYSGSTQSRISNVTCYADETDFSEYVLVVSYGYFRGNCYYINLKQQRNIIELEDVIEFYVQNDVFYHQFNCSTEIPFDHATFLNKYANIHEKAKGRFQTEQVPLFCFERDNDVLPKDNFVIRKITIEDKVMLMSFKEDLSNYDSIISAYEKYICCQDSRYEIYGLIREEELLSYCIIKNSDSYIEIRYFGTDERVREQGLMTQLLRGVGKLFQTMDKFVFYPITANPLHMRLAERAGYHRCDLRYVSKWYTTDEWRDAR